jgi:hypothetical protein
MTIRVHPAWTLTPLERMTLKAWLRQRSGGPLPFEGGLLRQPAWFVSAFGIMDAIANRLEQAQAQREAARRGNG